MVSVSAWEAIFMLVVLKIPMIYLAVVVWWAIKAEPIQGDGDEPVRTFVPLTPCDWGERRSRSPVRLRPSHWPTGPRGRRPVPGPRPRVGAAA